VNAAQRVPQVRTIHEELESLNWRFEERHWSVPFELRMASEAQSAAWLRAEQARAPLLAVGARERGWEPEVLLAGPRRAAMGSLAGGGLILVVWAWSRFSARRARVEAKEAHLQELEKQVRERGNQRRGPSS
jgi:hypothetical protein